MRRWEKLPAGIDRRDKGRITWGLKTADHEQIYGKYNMGLKARIIWGLKGRITCVLKTPDHEQIYGRGPEHARTHTHERTHARKNACTHTQTHTNDYTISDRSLSPSLRHSRSFQGTIQVPPWYLFCPLRNPFLYLSDTHKQGALKRCSISTKNSQIPLSG